MKKTGYILILIILISILILWGVNQGFQILPDDLDTYGTAYQVQISEDHSEEKGIETYSTPTQRSIHTRSPTFSPTPQSNGRIPEITTPQPTPTLQLSLAQPSGDSSQYTLKKPDPETIIKIQLSRTGQLAYSDTQLDDLLYPAFHDVIDLEWTLSYTHSLFSDNLFNLIPNFYDHTRGRLTTKMLTDLVGDHVIWFLNQQQMILDDLDTYSVDPFFGSLYKVEIDGESNPEWLMEVKDSTGFYLSNYSFWMTLDQNGSGTYHRLVNQLPWIWGSSSMSFPSYPYSDLTGDGLDDFVLIESNCHIGICDRQIHIAVGKKTGHYIISSFPNFIDDSEIKATEWAKLDWSSSLENGLPLLTITSFRDIGWDCIVASKSTFQWINGVEQVHSSSEEEYQKTSKPTLIQEIGKDDPQQMKCAIARSLDPGISEDLDTQILLLESHRNHWDNLPEADQVYLFYRLSLLYSLKGDRETTLRYLNRIKQSASHDNSLFAASLIAEIDSMNQKGSISPYELCLAAENKAKAPFKFSKIPNQEIWMYPYVGYAEGFPNPLCVSHSLLNILLPSLQIGGDQSPQAVLEDYGISAMIVQKIFLNRTDPNWLVIIQEYPQAMDNQQVLSDPKERGGYLVYWYTQEGGWVEIHATNLEKDVQFNLVDITRDNIVDFAYFQPNQNIERTNCFYYQKAVDVFLISTLGNNHLVSFNTTLCTEESNPNDPVSMLTDNDGDGILDILQLYFEENLFDLSNALDEITYNWWEISTPPYDDLARFHNKDLVLSDLTSRVIRGDISSEIINDLLFYLEIWGGEDSIGENIRAQINYLLALVDLQLGKETQSITRLFEIWKAYPETIWAYLASSQLQRK